MNSGAVSVIMPARNAARFVEQALLSALEQTVAPETIIVVDDGSDDGTAAIAGGLNERVVVHRQSHQGIGPSRDVGLALSRTDLIAFLDADDVWLPTKLERQLAVLSSCSEADAVFCLFDEFLDGVDPMIDGIRPPRTRQAVPLVSGALLRRSVVDRVGPFSGDPVGDWLRWWGRARVLGIAEHIVPEVLWRRRIHDLNNSRVRADGGHTFLDIVRAHRRDLLADTRRQLEGANVTTGASVSVVIPTYNRSYCVADAVESVLAQSHPPVECVVVDDGSVDGTYTFLANRFGDDGRVRVLGGANRGVSAARNRGVGAARGEFVTFVDSDDVMCPGAVESLLDCMARRRADAAVGRFERILAGRGTWPLSLQQHPEWRTGLLLQFCPDSSGEVRRRRWVRRESGGR